ncbi:DUF748 domain-containing protein [Aquabacterium sp.]|uniref:DUF748 domain-containing protein n=1 Tax=Aquabacterium sp. TaxID=1872578 RepID=UPI0019B086F2|nr:DUF748 domain-containing protein [Aquabacterium sp.]MBC7701670.1 DUF748 domain-containing protein [Aquabacterium sp.]
MSSTPVTPADSPHRKHWAWKLGIGLVLFALIWTVLLGWWLPRWARGQVESVATQALGTPVTLASLSVQPWTLTVSLNDLKVGPPKAELLQLPAAQVQLSLESIWRLAPVVRRITLEQPQVWVERQSAEHFNFTDIAKRLQSGSSQPAKDPARFAVYNIRINNGLVRYSDRVLQQEHRIEALNVGVPFVSNLPSFVSVDVQPLLEARVDGSPLRVSGRTLPFSEGLRSTLDLNWRDVDVAHWMLAAKPFMPLSAMVSVAKGRLDTHLTVSFEERKPPAAAALTIRGGLKVSGVDLGWPAGGVQGRWSSLDIEGIDASPLARQVKIGSVALAGLQVDAKDRPAVAAKPVVALDKPDKVAVSSSLEAPWAWSVDKVRLDATALQAEAPGGGALPKLGPVSLRIDGLNSNKQAAPAALTLAATDAHGGQFNVSGVVSPMLPQATLKVSVSKLQPAPWLAALGKAVPLPLQVLSGELAVSTELQADAQALSLLNGQLQLTGLKTKAAKAKAKATDHVDLAGLDVQGLEARVGLAPTATGLQSLTVASVTFDKLDAQATRDPQGQWMMQPAPGASSDAPVKPAKAQAAPLIKVGELRCKLCKVQVDDQSVMPAARLSLHQADLGLKNLSSDLTQVMGFDLSGLGQSNGRVKLIGDVRVQPLRVNSQLAIAGLDLTAFQSYIAPYLNVALVSAKTDVHGKLSLEAAPGKDPQALNARYQGRFALTDLRTQDSVNQADFLRWRSLALVGLDVNWKAGALNADLGRIALNDFYGRLIINPNGKLNLSDLVKHEAGAETKSLTTPQATPAAAPPAAAPVAANATASSASAPSPSSPAMAGMNLRWQGIKLSKGRVDFTDNFIKPNYSARLTQVEGDVSAVASSKPEPATVKISGAVDDSAPLLITGQLHPLGPRLYTDIQGSAKGIELTRLTPYAGRYAGYAIEKGTLSVTVHYKVDNGKLEAENHIFLDQLTFGDKVDSPDATSLPVQFAVSLLKNSRGEIDVSLPVSGSLDDPQFSVGGIVWRVVVNLLTKAVTAPFSLLMGGGQDELGFVPFEPGDDDLSDIARQRLDTLVTKLTDRPTVKLEATGRADPAIDEEGLRQRHVVSLMRQAKAKGSEQSLASVTIAPQERDQWLIAAYKAADTKKPRNLVGLAKTLPPAEMEALLKAAAPVDQASLMTLANRRGDRVKAYLATKLSPERVLLTASKVGTDKLPDDKGPNTRVQFALK